MSPIAHREAFGGFYAGKRVFITGHTGFKAGWMALWLSRLGAIVHGYALDPPTYPSLFETAGIAKVFVTDNRADLADLSRLKGALKHADAEIVFHLAAQPLVLAGYRDPLGTVTTNVMGTVNVLEAVRCVPTVRSLVLITTDKVYESGDGLRPHSENDPLGGHDPYSASKAAAEILAASYRASCFSGQGNHHPVNIATVRAGNVIGGGDWASDRLIPDCVRAFVHGEHVFLRCPHSVRPWQHVLEPLAGYLQLAKRLFASDGAQFAKAWNFGPGNGGDATVGEVAEIAACLWGHNARVQCASAPPVLHEAPSLRLDSTLARTELDWKPRWGLHRSIEQTVAWYRAWQQGADMAGISLDQICRYEAADPL